MFPIFFLTEPGVNPAPTSHYKGKEGHGQDNEEQEFGSPSPPSQQKHVVQRPTKLYQEIHDEPVGTWPSSFTGGKGRLFLIKRGLRLPSCGLFGTFVPA